MLILRSLLVRRSLGMPPLISASISRSLQISKAVSSQSVMPKFNISSQRSLITSPVDWKPVKAAKKNEWTTSKYIFLSLLILMPIISFMLGTWQLRRLKWKNNLIAVSEDRLTYPPIPLPKSIRPEDSDDWQYRRVIVQGKFDHSREVFVGPKVVNEMKGYTLYTPLIRSDGGEDILIERGFITDENILPQRRSLKHLSLPEHEVEIECIIKNINPKARITMEKIDPDSRLWHILDIEEMSEFTKTMKLHVCALVDLKDHPIETVTHTKKNWFGKSITTKEVQYRRDPGEVNEFSRYQFLKGGVPLGRSASIDYRNNHLNYLITWYGLSFASTILLFFVLKKKPNDPLKEKLKHARRHM
ncbi:hypothetical protein WICMUC_003762 [Wickerhamomyces mucosus]|uniref:SURF1-like protein n=1 Tax=Wickerhamomyces mucosus TaxID=1378264 RepID=A0A9P8PL12_9ASCO|nr:hypothetical protein WICMUC_003762 [Wickerhamomyces mucosus]